MAQPTISQHLKELKNAGLIKGDIEGNSVCYCIDEKAIQNYKAIFLSLLPSWKIGKETAVRKILVFFKIHRNGNCIIQRY